MCGLELKQEAFSKAVFCWLRVRLLVYVEWATFICSQIKFVKMAQMPAVPLPQESSCHPLSKPGQAGQPALHSSGSLPECMVLRRVGEYQWVKVDCVPGPTFLLCVFWTLLSSTACWESSRQRFMKPSPGVSSKIFLHLFSQDPKRQEKWELAELEIFKPI